MSKKGGSSQPSTPSVSQMTQAQTDANTAAAREQQRLNLINSVGPNGSVTYRADPNSPGGYTQVTSLSPGEQQNYDLTAGIYGDALGLGRSQIGRVSDALGRSMDTSGLPALQIGAYGGAIQGQAGPQDLNAARQATVDAAFGQARNRLDAEFGQQQGRLDARLANQGIGMNSDAYRTAQQDFGRTRNDAYDTAFNSAVAQGNDQYNQMFNQSLAQGQFANNAQDQGYQQSYNNAALSNTARQQMFGEQSYLNNLPIQQLQALLGTGSVSMPDGVGYTPTAVQPTDVLGAYGLNNSAQQAAANRQAQQSSGLLGGLFNLGSAAITRFSDRRLKRNVVKLWTRRDGIGVYFYRYLWDWRPRIGVMAQEVLRVKPQAVSVHGGFLAVNYGML